MFSIAPIDLPLLGYHTPRIGKVGEVQRLNIGLNVFNNERRSDRITFFIS